MEEQTAETTISQTVPSFDSDLKPVETGDFQSMIPEEYKDKPYMQKVTDVDSLFKTLDNAQQFLGKKMGKAPDMLSGYEVAIPEEMPEGVTFNEDIMNSAKEMAQKLGLTNEQLQGIVDFDIERQGGLAKQAGESQAQTKEQLDAEFSKMSQEAFGDRAEEVLKGANELLHKYSGQHTDKLESLDNNSLILLAMALDGIKNDYISEDRPVFNNNQTPSPQDQETLLSEVRGLLAKTDIRKNPLHPDHDKNESRIADIFVKLDAMGYKR